MEYGKEEKKGKNEGRQKRRSDLHASRARRRGWRRTGGQRRRRKKEERDDDDHHHHPFEEIEEDKNDDDGQKRRRCRCSRARVFSLSSVSVGEADEEKRPPARGESDRHR